VRQSNYREFFALDDHMIEALAAKGALYPLTRKCNAFNGFINHALSQNVGFSKSLRRAEKGE
jgi:hypothetical protein